MYMKNILKHRTFCPTSLTFLPDILCPISDMLNDKSYISSSLPRTLCPTFCNKTSDIEAKTSDMSGCPTTFRFHCFSTFGYQYSYSHPESAESEWGGGGGRLYENVTLPHNPMIR